MAQLQARPNGSKIKGWKGRPARALAVTAIPSVPVSQGEWVPSPYQFDNAVVDFCIAWAQDLIEQGIFEIKDGTLCVRKASA